MKLSIIVAVYNTAKYLEQCLESVLNQTMPQDDYEVIIVNDCSTDNSMELINEKIKGYSNVRVVDKKLNEATFWSRVDGIVEAKGDYVGFVDSDDWVAPNMYEVMVKKGTDSGADIVECGTIYMYDDGSSSMDDVRDEQIISCKDMIKTYSERPMQVALYLRIFSRKIIDTFLKEMYPYFNENRENYRGVRNEDDLLLPLFFSCGDKLLFIEESFCYHRAEIPGSTMDLIRKNPKRFVDSFIFRVNAGFDVMKFTNNRRDIYGFIEHKQINVIFGLLGKLLETDFYSKKESSELLGVAVERFNKEKKWLSLKDYLRFWHLRLKTFYCFKLGKYEKN